MRLEADLPAISKELEAQNQCELLSFNRHTGWNMPRWDFPDDW